MSSTALSVPSPSLPAAPGPRVLIVGAGSVGQVYGHVLARGGAQVTYRVREKYVAEVRRGFLLYRMRGLGGLLAPKPERFGRFDVITTDEEVAAQQWDQVWLTIASPALRGPWLAPFLEAIGDATLVTLQPGPEDFELLCEHLPASQLIQGLIHIVAYHTPMPEEDANRPHGMAWWVPPLTPMSFTGADEGRTRRVIEALGRGGMRARRIPSVHTMMIFATTALNSFLQVLELEGWSFRRLIQSGRLATAAQARAEAAAALSARWGVPVPGIHALLGPGTLELMLRAAPRLAPFPVEPFLREHFIKVGEQTRQTAALYIRLAEAHGLPCRALRALQAELLAADDARAARDGSL